jgi:alkaline phosphatase D
MTTRRRFLGTALAGAGVAGSLSALGLPRAVARTRARPARFSRDPFTLGVASGYPRADGMVLWTRLAPAPFSPDGGAGLDDLELRWEIAEDESFTRRLRSGSTVALADEAHTVHLEVSGLRPGRAYFYRFRAGDALSPVGRTWTAAAPGDMADRLRIGTASCQHYEQGFYHAWRDMVARGVDLVLHLGDYIYEGGSGNPVRKHDPGECMTLDEYRLRYAWYRSDPHLRAAHAACPWLVTWDDHEVDNDYAGLVAEELDARALFRARRAAAYQAYYEHLPLPRRAVPFGAHLRLHATQAFGDLARVVMLDGRQYRSPQACPPPGRSGGSTATCPERLEPARTMLGSRQEAWLAAVLDRSTARWNLLAQQTVMTPLDEQPGPGERFWTDSWNGYPAARDRLLGYLADRQPANPVVLSGDIHAFGAANLRRPSPDPATPVVASEFVTTSISSQGVPTKLAGQTQVENPDLLYGDATRRGYLRLELTPGRLTADMVGFDSLASRDAPVSQVRTFVVEAGRAGPRPA